MGRLALALFATGALLGFAGCVKRTLDADKLEKTVRQMAELRIADSARKAGVKVTKVKCPKRELKEGDLFSCDFTVLYSDGPSTFGATVYQLNDKGNLSIDVPDI